MRQNQIIIPYHAQLVSHYHTDPNTLIGIESLQMDYQLSQRYKPTDLFYLQASDNGMSLSGIQKHDKLLIAAQDDFTPTNIVVLISEDEPAIIRYVQEEGSYYIIKPTNPDYPVTILPKESVQILGIVLKAWQEATFL